MRTFLITSGGTKVRLDEVRHVGNMSSGRFGADIARAALRAGHYVVFLYAKGSIRPDQAVLDLDVPYADLLQQVTTVLADQAFLAGVRDNLNMIEYSDFDDYAKKLEIWARDTPDVTILAAAVSDYGMPPTDGKISSDKDEITFTMTKLPKLITKIREWAPETLLVGFKLLVDTTLSAMTEAANKQIKDAGSDFVVANDLRDIKQGRHTLYVYGKTGAPFVSNTNPAEFLVRFLLQSPAQTPKGVSYPGFSIQTRDSK